MSGEGLDREAVRRRAEDMLIVRQPGIPSLGERLARDAFALLDALEAAEAEVARLRRVTDTVHAKHLRALREAKRLRAYIAALESEVAGSMSLSALVHDENRTVRGPDRLRTEGGAS